VDEEVFKYEGPLADL